MHPGFRLLDQNLERVRHFGCDVIEVFQNHDNGGLWTNPLYNWKGVAHWVAFVYENITIIIKSMYGYFFRSN